MQTGAFRSQRSQETQIGSREMGREESRSQNIRKCIEDFASVSRSAGARTRSPDPPCVYPKSRFDRTLHIAESGDNSASLYSNAVMLPQARLRNVAQQSWF